MYMYTHGTIKLLITVYVSLSVLVYVVKCYKFLKLEETRFMSAIGNTLYEFLGEEEEGQEEKEERRRRQKQEEEEKKT